MKFRLVADAVFEAKDIDDAFAMVGSHFVLLHVGQDPHVFESGEVTIAPVESEAPPALNIHVNDSFDLGDLVGG